MRAVDVLLAFPGLLARDRAHGRARPEPPERGDRALPHRLDRLRPARARRDRAPARARVRRGRARARRTRGRILCRHLMPLLATPLLVQATFGMAAAIVAEASLSFLGLGAQPPTASWGAMLNDGRAFVLVAPHLTRVSRARDPRDGARPELPRRRPPRSSRRPHPNRPLVLAQVAEKGRSASVAQSLHLVRRSSRYASAFARFAPRISTF